MLIRFFLTLLGLGLAGNLLAASIDASIIGNIPLGEKARQVAASPDGQRIYVLLESGQVLIISSEGQSLGSFDAGDDVQGIAPQGANRLILQLKERQQLVLVALEAVAEINTSGAPTLGNPDAPVAIVVFDDFECPYCARAAPLLKQVQASYPEQSKLVFKNFPLNMHKHAREAALAGLAAQRQGKFWPLHDQIFANYNQLSSEKIRQLAEQVGLDMAKFAEDMKDPELQKRITTDQQEGRRIGVRGTPAIYVNGRVLQQRSLDGFKKLIEEELAKATPATKEKK